MPEQRAALDCNDRRSAALHVGAEPPEGLADGVEKIGTPGRGVLAGGSGKDILRGQPENDTLRGGDMGDDGKGIDAPIVGGGADRFVPSADPATGCDIGGRFRPGATRVALDISVFDALTSRKPPAGRHCCTTMLCCLMPPTAVVPVRPWKIARSVGAPDLVATDIFVF